MRCGTITAWTGGFTAWAEAWSVPIGSIVAQAVELLAARRPPAARSRGMAEL
jgi:hypothetical protein